MQVAPDTSRAAHANCLESDPEHAPKAAFSVKDEFSSKASANCTVNESEQVRDVRVTRQHTRQAARRALETYVESVAALPLEAPSKKRRSGDRYYYNRQQFSHRYIYDSASFRDLK